MDVDWCYKNYLNHRHLKAADDVRTQLKDMMKKIGIPVSEEFPINSSVGLIKKCILTGYFTQIAILQKNNVYLTSNNFIIFSQRFPSCRHPPQLCSHIPTKFRSIPLTSPDKEKLYENSDGY